jgi:hypothetical protein
MWHHSINFSHVARDHGSTTASQPWKALISGLNKMCRCFLCTFPGLLLPLSCSFFVILALRSSWSKSIAKSCEPTSSNHVVKWSQLLFSPMTYLASSCLRNCRPRCRGFGHCIMAKGRRLIVPRAHAAIVSRESSGANALMPVQMGCSSARTVRRQARTIFLRTFTYIRRARMFVQQARTDTTRALTGVDGM